MTEHEMAEEFERLRKMFTDADYDALEQKMILHAYVRGWTGDPLQQPADVVLNIAKQVIAERGPR